MGIFHRIDESHGRTGHTTIVAPGTKITGTLRSTGGLHVDGEIDGSVEAKSYVIVAKGGVVHGDIHAREVYLDGVVNGDIWAIEVEIYDNGVCHGHIEAIRINKG
ncbi:polymer-forming cytoskeletal protein [Hydrogenimonas sp.]|uniref:bactofilin family protein n=1 Tax=Hydrogenimonas sp. TaxID=2231112 RepID=UPI00261FEA85|nr:polymer-forming cytoskeletal protein [Hydrogenimonas sp.]